MYQEMIRLLKEMKVNNAMSKIKVWMEKKTPYSMVHAEHSCLWPHALFSTLYHDYPDKFKECLCGVISVIWKSLGGTCTIILGI